MAINLRLESDIQLKILSNALLHLLYSNQLTGFSWQVLPMETSDGGADSDSMAGLLHLASADLPALLLHLSAGIELCSHLQQHVSAGTPHLLLLRLWRPQFLQPG